MLSRVAAARALLAKGVAQGDIGSALAQGWTSAINKVQADSSKSGLSEKQLKILDFRLNLLTKRIKAAVKAS